MLLYTNGRDDYGKRDMTLRRLLDFIKCGIETSESKEEMINVLSMVFDGDFDAEFIPNPTDLNVNGVEYTGLDPIYYTPRIEKIFNRQVFIIGDIFTQRYSNLDYDKRLKEYIGFTRRYFLNTKKIVCNLPFPITIEDQNWICSY